MTSETRQRPARRLRSGVVVLVTCLAMIGVGHLARSAGSPGAPRFSHAVHVTDSGIECVTCHADVPASTTGRDDHLPTKETCAECHDVDDPDECLTCHEAAPATERFARVLDYSPKFSHAAHLKRDATCGRCHPGVIAQETAGRAALPDMDACVACHRQEGVDADCRVCHLPDEELRPADHLEDWTHAHQDVARQERESCGACHADDMCQECHHGDNLFQRTHPANFEYDHAFDARGGENDCAACHEAASFCTPCHRENIVVSHPLFDADWANRADGGRHAEEAEHDLGACMACHDDGRAEPVCAQCHGD